MSGPKKSVVFDFGAVVFHWRPGLLLQRVLPQRATDEASTAHWVAQFFEGYSGDWGEFDRGTIEPDDLVQRIARRTGLEPDEVQCVVDAVPAELQPMPESLALLHELRDAGHELFYLSNMPAPYARHLVDRQAAVMRAFRDGVFSSSVQLIKPDPRIFELAAQRFGKAPGELVFLDDSLANVESARKAGWSALHFHDAAQARREMQAEGWMR